MQLQDQLLTNGKGLDWKGRILKEHSFFYVLLLIDWLGLYTRFVDHLAVRNVAQGEPVGSSFAITIFVTIPYHYDFYIYYESSFVFILGK